MQLPNSAVKGILATMPQAQRQQIAGIMSGRITHAVYCLSKTCHERLMGHIYTDGKFRAVTEEETGKMWCRASRNRLDGHWGFQCWCGNDSRLAAQEKGNKGIESNGVTKADLERVWEAVQAHPSNYPELKGRQIVDGFMLVRVG